VLHSACAHELISEGVREGEKYLLEEKCYKVAVHPSFRNVTPGRQASSELPISSHPHDQQDHTIRLSHEFSRWEKGDRIVSFKYYNGQVLPEISCTDDYIHSHNMPCRHILTVLFNIADYAHIRDNILTLVGDMWKKGYVERRMTDIDYTLASQSYSQVQTVSARIATQSLNLTVEEIEEIEHARRLDLFRRYSTVSNLVTQGISDHNYKSVVHILSHITRTGGSTLSNIVTMVQSLEHQSTISSAPSSTSTLDNQIFNPTHSMTTATLRGGQRNQRKKKATIKSTQITYALISFCFYMCFCI